MTKKINMPLCVIMAGGLGSRLGAITKYKPKSAINIHNKPFIFFKLDNLIENGFSNFLFLLSYKSTILIELISDYLIPKNIKFEFILDEKRSGTFNAIHSIKKKLPQTFFYTNGDEISDIEYPKMYKSFVDKNILSMSLLKEDINGLLTINANYIKLSKKKTKINYKELGCKFLNRDIFLYVDRDYNKIEDFLYTSLARRKKMGYFLGQNMPIRIDTPMDVKRTNEILNK